jgi:hypothetical protein
MGRKGGSFGRGAVSLGGGNVRLVAAGVTALVGIITTLNVATAKNSFYQQNLTIQGAYILSRFIPQPTLGKILAPMTNNAITTGTSFPAPGIAYLGFLNQTTLAGGLTLLVNGALHMVHLPFYNQYVGPFIAALGLALLIGGVVGGILDPPGDGSSPGGGTPILSSITSAGSGGLSF